MKKRTKAVALSITSILTGLLIIEFAIRPLFLPFFSHPTLFGILIHEGECQKKSNSFTVHLNAFPGEGQIIDPGFDNDTLQNFSQNPLSLQVKWDLPTPQKYNIPIYMTNATTFTHDSLGMDFQIDDKKIHRISIIFELNTSSNDPDLSTIVIFGENNTSILHLIVEDGDIRFEDIDNFSGDITVNEGRDSGSYKIILHPGIVFEVYCVKIGAWCKN